MTDLEVLRFYFECVGAGAIAGLVYGFFSKLTHADD